MRPRASPAAGVSGAPLAALPWWLGGCGRRWRMWKEAASDAEAAEASRQGLAYVEPFDHADIEALRPVLNAENALAEAIFLCDHLAEKQSNGHPEGDEYVTHYVVAHGLWAAVLREKQNLRRCVQTAVWGNAERSNVTRLIVIGDLRGPSALDHLPKPRPTDV